MNNREIAEAVRGRMPESRWQHTQGVTDSAIKLAAQYGADLHQAELAALLHDCCKYWPVEEQAKLLKEQGMRGDGMDEVLDFDKELWHAPAGAFVAFRDYGVSDGRVLDAIRYHTTGRRDMSLLDKIICLADYIEPGRNFPGVNIIRELAEHSLEKALIAGFDSTIRVLLERGKRIYPLTVMARNSFLQAIAQ
ncbi:MAG: YqeK [Paenibacillaceae bacterium]|nr:YqeK [Paenibacillaceae bacterium]